MLWDAKYAQIGTTITGDFDRDIAIWKDLKNQWLALNLELAGDANSLEFSSVDGDEKYYVHQTKRGNHKYPWQASHMHDGYATGHSEYPTRAKAIEAVAGGELGMAGFYKVTGRRGGSIEKLGNNPSFDLDNLQMNRLISDLEETFDWEGSDGEAVLAEFLDEHTEYQDREVPKTILQKWYRNWAKGRILTVVARLSSLGNPIQIWRVIKAPRNWKPDARALGIYWSWDRDSAQAYWEGGKTGDVKWRVGSEADLNQINWPATIVANADPTLGDAEKEIRLKENAQVPILSLEVAP